MAIVQISKIQVRTGSRHDLPQLDTGELGFATDDRTVFIGNDKDLYPAPADSAEPTLTQLLTNSPNCHINASQITGILTIPVENLKLGGGTNGQYLQTDGNGTISWAAGGSGSNGSPGGSTTQIQFNDASNFAGDSKLTFNKTTGALTVTGNVSATNISGTLLTASQTNITSVGTLANLTTVANGNINLGGELIITNQNQHGGSGYAGMITLTNQANGTPNPNKFVRLNNAGDLEIVDSNYQYTIFTLTDIGNVVAPYFVGDGQYLYNVNASSVDTLNGLTAVGTVNFIDTSNVSLGSISNLHITGGTNGQVLKTDGSGGLSWTTITGGNSNISSYGNSDVDLRIASYTGNVAKAVYAYSVDGANVSGTVSLATTATRAGTVTTNAQPNITSVGTLTSLTVGNSTANTQFGNGTITATGNISGLRFTGNGYYLTGVNGANVGGTVPNATYAVTAGTAGTATTVDWTGISSTPSTINGYGITDAYGPLFIASVSTGQGIPTSPTTISQVTLVYDSVSTDTDNGYDNSTGIFTAPLSGFYQVNASIAVAPSNWASVSTYNSAGVIGVYKNNNPIASGPYIDFRGIILGGVVLQAITASSISNLVYLNSGDTLRCKLAYLTTAPSNFWNTNTNIIEGYFQASWIRP